MEWKHLNRLPVCFVLFLPLFCLFSTCFVSPFDTRFVFTIVFYTKHHHIQRVLFKVETPLSSLSRVLPHWPTGGHFSGWDWWRNGELFFFFLIKQFRKISQVRFRGDSGIYKQASAYTVISVALKQRSTPNHKNHVWTRQRRKGPRKGRRQTSSQGVA